jgi:hypothetical protein
MLSLFSLKPVYVLNVFHYSNKKVSDWLEVNLKGSPYISQETFVKISL